MLAWSLSERAPSSVITVNCVNPGYVLTDLTLNSGPLVQAAVRLTRFRAQSAREGADTAIWAAASADIGGVTGRFWSRRREIDWRFREPTRRAELSALLDRQLATAGR